MLRIHTQGAPRADVGRPSVGQWCAAALSSQPLPSPRPNPRPRPRPRPSSSPSPSPNPHEPGAPPRRSAVISCAASSSRWERSANCTRLGCSLQGCRRARCSACTGGRWASSAASCESRELRGTVVEYESTGHSTQQSQRARAPRGATPRERHGHWRLWLWRERRERLSEPHTSRATSQPTLTNIQRSLSLFLH